MGALVEGIEGATRATPSDDADPERKEAATEAALLRVFHYVENDRVLNRSSDPNLFEIAQTESQLSQIVSVEADWQLPSAPVRIGGLLYRGRDDWSARN
jgi:hypothetical protein